MHRCTSWPVPVLSTLCLLGVGCGSSGKSRDASRDATTEAAPPRALDATIDATRLDSVTMDMSRVDAVGSEAGPSLDTAKDRVESRDDSEAGAEDAPKPTSADAPAFADLAPDSSKDQTAPGVADAPSPGDDALPDTAADTRPYQGPDSLPDPGPDAAPDEAADMGPNPGPDAAPDVLADTAQDAGPDSAPAAMAASQPSYTFPATQAGGGVASYAATFSNSGGSPTGTLAVSLTGQAGYAIAADACTGNVLQPGATCAVTIEFSPATTGTLATTLAVSAAPGGSASVSLTGLAGYKLTVIRAMSTDCPSCVVVTDSATSPALSCGLDGGACSAVYPVGTVLTLTAQVQANGSGHWFTGLSGGGCSGLGRTCQVTLDASKTVTANYPELINNLIFVSSELVHMGGGTLMFDGVCNQLAAAVGINSAEGHAYTALASWGDSDAYDRLLARNSTVANWRRMDGTPVAGSLLSWFGLRATLSDIRFDEQGQVVSDQDVATGTDQLGRTASNCNDFTSNGSGTGVMVGNSTGGPELFTAARLLPCSSTYRIYCAMTSSSAPMTIDPISKSKRIWVSSATFTPSTNLLKTPDAVCKAALPTGVTNAKALVATTTTSAASLLASMTPYVRPDNMVVGTGAQIAANDLRTGIWVNEAGTYVIGDYNVWTGAASPGAVGTSESTCGNWTSTASTAGQFGEAVDLPARWWTEGTQACDSTTTHLYCFEP